MFGFYEAIENNIKNAKISDKITIPVIKNLLS